MLRRPLVLTLGSRRPLLGMRTYPLLGMRTYRGHNRIEDMLTASEACRSLFSSPVMSRRTECYTHAPETGVALARS